MTRTTILILTWASALMSQTMKLQQVDHTTAVHRLSFTFSYRAIHPATVTVKAGIYQIQFRNGETAKDVIFDVGQKNKTADPADSSKITHGRSAAAYGWYRLTPGSYVITVRGYPQTQTVIEVVP